MTKDKPCACGVPGAGNAIKCHRAHYGSASTWEIGGRGVRRFGECKCSCHLKPLRRRHSRDGAIRCEICSPLRCSKARK